MSIDKKLNIEKSLRRSLNEAPILDFEKLAKIPVTKLTEHDYITRQTGAAAKKHGKIPRYFKPISAAVASCLVVLVCVSAWFVEFKTPDSIIALDANQSVEIVTNKHKEILSIKAFDQEVQDLLDVENFDQSNLEDSVGVIISTMIKNGYLDESKNVVMVSVENTNAEKANDLATSLNKVIVESASAQNLETTVIRQSVTPDQQTLSLAEQYSVSSGKLNVMQELVAADSSLTLDSLSTLSLTDLLEVSKQKEVDLTGIIQVDQEPQKDTQEVQSPVDTTTDERPAVTQTDTTTENQTTTETKETKQTEIIVTENPVTVPTEITITETPVTSVEKDTETDTDAETDKTTLEIPAKEKSEPDITEEKSPIDIT